MGLFGNKQPKPYVSNGRLYEIVTDSSSDGITGDPWVILEKKLERCSLYRNVETIIPRTNASVIVKYKDLKVRSEIEVKMMREKMRKEAGLDIER